jgi:DNA-binding PucR family transcriptional regulator
MKYSAIRRLITSTLEVFLTTGSNYTIAADKLHVHPNTIKYRIRKARDKLRVSRLTTVVST